MSISSGPARKTCVISTPSFTVVNNFSRFPSASASSNVVLCGIVVLFQSWRLEPFLQNASKYQISIVLPGSSGADTVSKLFVHEIRKPSSAPTGQHTRANTTNIHVKSEREFMPAHCLRRRPDSIQKVCGWNVV